MIQATQGNALSTMQHESKDTETILKVLGVGKHYQGFIALQNVSFTLNKGDIFGLLGRNGGGKTTLIKILTSLISDYHGEVEFLGYNLKEKQRLIFFKQHIAYLPDRDFLYTHINGRQSIAFFKDFFTDFCEERALEIFDLLQISSTQKIGTMSKGQAEKLALALTLARNAKLYLFDEPLAGADVISRDEIFRIIGRYCSHGASIIATHLISSVETILNKALFLNTKMMAYGSKEELCYGFGNLEESFRYYAADTTIKPLVRGQQNKDSQSTMNHSGDSSLSTQEKHNNDSHNNSLYQQTSQPTQSGIVSHNQAQCKNESAEDKSQFRHETSPTDHSINHIANTTKETSCKV